MKPAVLHDRASAELDEAAAWYERQRPGLGGQFRAAVERTVLRIQEDPQIGQVYEATRFRYCLVRRFPYVVFFCEGEQAIRVLAIAHGRRRPGYWMDRDVE